MVLHTNLGRALLCEDALNNIRSISQSFSNLEMNIKTGKRGIRYEAIDELICELTGAQSAIAVNNNAGAVFLALNTIAEGREVVVSRGELVEIGGSFRVPDVMSKSGCILKEVGTTNRTHLKDYETAVCDQTGLFLKVHASNYKIEGFTASVGLQELVKLGSDKNIPIILSPSDTYTTVRNLEKLKPGIQEDEIDIVLKLIESEIDWDFLLK